MKKILLFNILFFFHFSISQTLDTTFNSNHNGPFQEHVGEYAIITPDNKILTHGINGNYSVKILNYDGSEDTQNPMNNSTESYYDMYNYLDGKFIIFYSDGSGGLSLRVHNPDGTLTNNFTSPIFNGGSLSIKDLAYDGNGKIIVVGDFLTVNGVSAKNIIRLNSDGSIDTSFTTGTGPNNAVHSVVVLNDGRCIIGGQFTNFNGVNRNYIVRLNSNGTLDTTFTNNNGSSYFANSIYDLVVQPDGKILVGGPNFIKPNYPPSNIFSNQVTRLNADGSIDITFRCTFSSWQTYNTSIQLLPDGKILAILQNSTSQTIKRLQSNGQVDTTFNYQNLNFYTYPLNALNIYSDGKILVNSSWKSSTGLTRIALHRINSNGSIDLSFNPQQSTNVSNNFLQVLSNNKLILAGFELSSYNETPCKNIIRVDENGELDSSFSLDSQISIPYQTNVLVIKEQQDNKILLYCDTYLININGENKKFIRLNSNGSYDPSFNFSITGLSEIKDFELLDDGRIIALVVTSSGSKSMRRYNSDGTLDATFPTYNYGNVKKLFKFKNGSIFSLTTAPTYNDRIYKLNPDGTVDTGFTSLYLNNVITIQQQSDSKIIYSELSSQQVRLKRLNADGSIDTTFNVTSYSTLGTLFNQLFINSEGNIVALSEAHLNQMSLFNANGTPLNTYEIPDYKFAIQQGCDKIVVNPTISDYPLDIKRYNLISGPIVPAPSGSSYQGFTNGETLADLDVVGQNILWYDSPSECELLLSYRSTSTQTTSDLPSSTPLVNGMTYYASQTIGGIESKSRLPITVNSTLGLNQNQNDVVFIKNPVETILEISSKETIQKIEIYNLQGMKILESNTSNATDFEISIENLSNAIYLIKIYGLTKVYQEKILKI